MSADAPAPVTDVPPSTVLEPVKVPRGCYPIEVVQFWRGQRAAGRPFPLHWVIFIRTSARRGNRHEIVGAAGTYKAHDTFNVHMSELGEWRGSHVVGYVAPEKVDDLLDHIALVPVVRQRWTWSDQDWVYDALKGLNQPGLYTNVEMSLGSLQTQMSCLLESWELGDI